MKWVFDLEKDPSERDPITNEEIVSHMLRELKGILARDMLRFRGR